MPIIFKDEALESSLENHARRQPIPTTKTELTKAILRNVIAAADAKGVHAGRMIERLQLRRKPTAA